MKKLLFALFILLRSCDVVWASPPSRQNTYTPNTVISSTDVTENEDAIFNYLQAGVDTYADGTIVNADVNTSANIQSEKLNLGNVAQAVVINSSGSLTVAGTTSLTGSAAFTTVTNLGTVTTGIITGIDLNGGSLDGVAIGTAVRGEGNFTYLRANGSLNFTNTANVAGGVIYDDGSKLARSVAGTSGQFLKSNGTSAPTWTSTGSLFTSNTTVSSANNTGNISITSTKYYKVVCRFHSLDSTDIYNLRFNNDTGTNYNNGTASQSLLVLTGTVQGNATPDTDHIATIVFYIFPQNGTTGRVFMESTSIYTNTSNNPARTEAMGFWDNDAEVTSFRILTAPSNASFSGTVLVYELTTS